jgi:hypothetical protein
MLVAFPHVTNGRHRDGYRGAREVAQTDLALGVPRDDVFQYPDQAE